MFGDDSFDRLVRDFFGQNSGSLSGRGGMSNRVSKDQNSIVSNMVADYDRVETGSDYFVIVNFMESVKKGDVVLEVEDDFDETGSDGWFGGGDKVLMIKNRAKKDSYLKVRIPKKVSKRKISHTLNNGILEVRFGK